MELISLSILIFFLTLFLIHFQPTSELAKQVVRAIAAFVLVLIPFVVIKSDSLLAGSSDGGMDGCIGCTFLKPARIALFIIATLAFALALRALIRPDFSRAFRKPHWLNFEGGQPYKTQLLLKSILAGKRKYFSIPIIFGIYLFFNPHLTDESAVRHKIIESQSLDEARHDIQVAIRSGRYDCSKVAYVSVKERGSSKESRYEFCKRIWWEHMPY